MEVTVVTPMVVVVVRRATEIAVSEVTVMILTAVVARKVAMARNVSTVEKAMTAHRYVNQNHLLAHSFALMDHSSPSSRHTVD